MDTRFSIGPVLAILLIFVDACIYTMSIATSTQQGSEFSNFVNIYITLQYTLPFIYSIVNCCSVFHYPFFIPVLFNKDNLNKLKLS